MRDFFSMRNNVKQTQPFSLRRVYIKFSMYTKIKIIIEKHLVALYMCIEWANFYVCMLYYDSFNWKYGKSEKLGAVDRKKLMSLLKSYKKSNKNFRKIRNKLNATKYMNVPSHYTLWHCDENSTNELTSRVLCSIHMPINFLNLITFNFKIIFP